MKTVIQLPVPPFSVFQVEVGDVVTNKTVLAQMKKSGAYKHIPIAKLLGAPPATISKYLKKTMSEKVSIGDILAAKRGVFSSSYVKSPVSGSIKEIDMKEGVLTLTLDEEQTEHIYAHVSGTVIRIGNTAIDIEIDGHELPAHKGDGQDVAGLLTVTHKHHAGMFDFPDEVDGRVVASPSLSEESVVKLDVLGAKGCIVTEMQADCFLPWVAISTEHFEQLSRYEGSHVVMRPSIRQVIVCH